MTKSQQRLIKTKDASRILDLSPEMVRVLVRQGKLPAIALPDGSHVFDEKTVQQVAYERAMRRAG